MIETPIPSGVSVQMRSNAAGDWLFLMNFRSEAASMKIPAGWQSVLGENNGQDIELGAYGGAVLRRATTQE